MFHLLLALCFVAPGPSIEERMAVLRSHFDRLQVIEVTADARPQATADLAELSTMLKSTPTTGEAIDRIYERMDEIRTWLLAHAQDRPAMPAGEFRESATEWNVYHDHLSLTIAKKDLSMAVKTPAGFSTDGSASITCGQPCALRANVRTNRTDDAPYMVLFSDGHPARGGKTVGVKMVRGLGDGDNYVWAEWTPDQVGEHMLWVTVVDSLGNEWNDTQDRLRVVVE